MRDKIEQEELEIIQEELEIIKAFNSKPKDGINLLKEKFPDKPYQAIADFFHKHKGTLDLEKVGDYLGTKDVEEASEKEHEMVLEAFIKSMDFKGKGVVDGLRIFLQDFKLPGEAQKISELIQCYSKAYFEQNANTGIANEDAAFVLAFSIIMLNTDLHNAGNHKKMTPEQYKNNLRGLNNGKDFPGVLLEEIYNQIAATPFQFNFSKTSPGYEIKPTKLDKDPTLIKWNSLLQSAEKTQEKTLDGKVKTNFELKSIQGTFPDMSTITASLDKPKPLLNLFTGYSGTITLTDQKTKGQATVQIYNPSLLSKWFLGEKPKVIIQPVYADGKSRDVHLESINLAAKLASSFDSPVSSTTATYEYEKKDLDSAYNNAKQSIDQEKKSTIVEKFKGMKEDVQKMNKNEDLIGDYGDPQEGAGTNRSMNNN